MSVDNINHPEHYETNGIECFDAILASQGEDSAKEFCICNAFKYIWRNKHKNSSTEDIKKAIWYLNKFVELSEGAETDGVISYEQLEDEEKFLTGVRELTTKI